MAEAGASRRRDGSTGGPRRGHRWLAVLTLTWVLVPVAVAAGVAVAGPAGAAPAGIHLQDPAPTLPSPEPSADESRSEADEILSREEFQPPEQTWVDRVLEWIGDRIEELLRRLSFQPGAAGGGGGASVVAWVVIALLVGLVIFLVARAMGRRKARDGDPVDDAVFVSEVESRRSSDEWLAQAARHEDAGEWKAALRCRYRALIVELIEHGVVRDLPGRTSGEFRLEVRRRSPSLDAAFTTASGLFDEAFYGDLPTGPAESVRFQDAAAQIVEGLRRPAEAVGASGPSGFVAPGTDG